MFNVGDFCKHFKGHSLEEKNIYRIISMNVAGKDIDTTKIKYSGDNTLEEAKDLVVYANIFQDNKMFCREYSDLIKELSEEQQLEFNQIHRVDPLTEDEILEINSNSFKQKKKENELKKVKK